RGRVAGDESRRTRDRRRATGRADEAGRRALPALGEQPKRDLNPAPLRTAPSSTMDKPLTRSEVAVETTWDLADLFVTRDAWVEELSAVERAVESVVRYQDRLAAGPAVLLACLDARDALLARLERADAFAGLREAEDGGNAAHQADLSNSAAVGARVHAAVKFIDSEILALPEGTIAAWLRDEPALAVYRPTLDELAALKPHMLCAETERVLASLGEVLDAPHTIYSRAKTGDMDF